MPSSILDLAPQTGRVDEDELAAVIPHRRVDRVARRARDLRRRRAAPRRAAGSRTTTCRRSAGRSPRRAARPPAPAATCGSRATTRVEQIAGVLAVDRRDRETPRRRRAGRTRRNRSSRGSSTLFATSIHGLLRVPQHLGDVKSLGCSPTLARRRRTAASPLRRSPRPPDGESRRPSARADRR